MANPCKNLRCAYFGLLAATALILALSEAHYLPVGYLPATPQTQYATSLASCFLTLGGVYLALRLPAMPRAKRQMADTDAKRARTAYARWHGLQLFCIALPLLGNALLYYATPYSPAAGYALLISLIAVLFCYPPRLNEAKAP